MVVGFDDLFLGDLLRRPVTTVVQPVEDLGRHAVRLLLQDIAVARRSSAARAPAAAGRPGERAHVAAAEPFPVLSTRLMR